MSPFSISHRQNDNKMLSSPTCTGYVASDMLPVMLLSCSNMLVYISLINLSSHHCYPSGTLHYYHSLLHCLASACTGPELRSTHHVFFFFRPPSSYPRNKRQIRTQPCAYLYLSNLTDNLCKCHRYPVRASLVTTMLYLDKCFG